MTGLEQFLDTPGGVVRVRLTGVRGSSPRDVGAEMFVSATGLHGTIGGGQLEYMAIDKARAMLASGADGETMDVPLGPEIGQCCGGRVDLALTRLDARGRAEALAAEAARQAALPQVYVLGAGHVGRALAALLAHMPVRTILIDSRAEELALCTAAIEKRLSALPEAEIRAAPPGSAFIVLTHDHALDFLLAAEALGRGDAAYVGLIGSATKRAKFRSFCAAEAPGVDPAPLVCPIGDATARDKRPEIIAASTLAQVLEHLTGPQTALAPPETHGA